MSTACANAAAGATSSCALRHPAGPKRAPAGPHQCTQGPRSTSTHALAPRRGAATAPGAAATTTATAAAAPGAAGAGATPPPAADRPANDPDQLLAAAAILRAAADSDAATDSNADAARPAPLDSFEEDARQLLLRGAPAALGPDALSTAVGILRQRLDDEGAACALSGRLLDLLQLLDRRPAATAAAAAPGSSSGAVDGAVVAAAAQGFWGEPDDWSDIRTALMQIGVDATVDDEEVEDDVTRLRRLMTNGGVRFDQETGEKLAAFLGELQQQRVGGSSGSSSGAAAVAARRAGGGREDEDEDEEVSAEEEKWWGDVTAAYGKLWEQAKAQQPGAEGGAAVAAAQDV
jgi:hypothetical protein